MECQWRVFFDAIEEFIVGLRVDDLVFWIGVIPELRCERVTTGERSRRSLLRLRVGAVGSGLREDGGRGNEFPRGLPETGLRDNDRLALVGPDGRHPAGRSMGCMGGWRRDKVVEGAILVGFVDADESSLFDFEFALPVIESVCCTTNSPHPVSTATEGLYQRGREVEVPRCCVVVPSQRTGGSREMIRFKDDPHGMERTKEEMLQRTIFECENKNSNGGRLAYP